MATETQTLLELTVITPGGDEFPIEAPPDLRVAEFLGELKRELKLAARDGDGNPVEWKLTDKTAGRELQQTQTLEQNGVEGRHLLSLVRETVAG